MKTHRRSGEMKDAACRVNEKFSSACVCGLDVAYQYTADSLGGTGLLTVCSPVQGDLALTVWDADVGIVLDQKANVFGSVIKR